MKNMTASFALPYTDVAVTTPAVVVVHSAAVRAQRRQRHVAPVAELQRSAAPGSIKNLSLVQDKAARAAHRQQLQATLQQEVVAEQNTEYIRLLTTTTSWSKFIGL